MSADDAYDGKVVCRASSARRHTPPDVIIPPRFSAVPSTEDPAVQTPRDYHILLTVESGQIGWLRAAGTERAHLVEIAIVRHKHLIGQGLRALTLPGQQNKAAVALLDRMIQTAKAGVHPTSFNLELGGITKQRIVSLTTPVIE